jgi:hypothetical protein
MQLSASLHVSPSTDAGMKHLRNLLILKISSDALEQSGDANMSNVTRHGDGEKTSHTHFGDSVESQAQIRDSAVATGETAERLNIYRLEPTASIDDPRWQGAPPSNPITVAARTSGDARIVASSLEVDFMKIDSAPAEDVTTVNASAYRDEKLFTVIEIEHGRSDIRRGLLEGFVQTDPVRPLQD